MLISFWLHLAVRENSKVFRGIPDARGKAMSAYAWNKPASL